MRNDDGLSAFLLSHQPRMPSLAAQTPRHHQRRTNNPHRNHR